MIKSVSDYKKVQASVKKTGKSLTQTLTDLGISYGGYKYGERKVKGLPSVVRKPKRIKHEVMTTTKTPGLIPVVFMSPDQIKEMFQ